MQFQVPPLTTRGRMSLLIIPALEVEGFSGTVQGLGVQLTRRAECTDYAHVTDGPVRALGGAADPVSLQWWRQQGRRPPQGGQSKARKGGHGKGM